MDGETATENLQSTDYMASVQGSLLPGKPSAFKLELSLLKVKLDKEVEVFVGNLGFFNLFTE